MVSTVWIKFICTIIVLPPDGPIRTEKIEVSGFYIIIVNLIQLYEFVLIIIIKQYVKNILSDRQNGVYLSFNLPQDKIKHFCFSE